jgi:hypothetical protein
VASSQTSAPPLDSPADAARSGPGLARLQFLAATLAYGAITVVLFWPVVRHIANSFPADLGDPPNESWLIAWSVHALTTAPSQLLQGNIYYPHANALIYNDTLLGLLPLSAPLYLLSGGNAALTYNVLFLLSFVMCGAFSYLLARYMTGSTAGAFLAGIIVAFCPYRMSHLGHLNQLSGQWLPLVLLFWERARNAAAEGNRARLWRELACMVLFYAMMALCSIYYAAFLATCLLVYMLAYVRHTGWERAKLFVAGVIAAGAGLMVVLLPVIVPYLRLQSTAVSQRGRDQAIFFAADLRDFVRMPPSSELYGWTERALGVPGHDAQQYLFPGLVALALAGLAWRRRRGTWEIGMYTGMLLLAGILALGVQLKAFDRLYSIPLPFALLYDHVPGFQSFRDIARFFFIGFIALALLAAWGVASLERRMAGGPPRRARLIATLLCVACLAEYWIAPIDTPLVATGNGVPQVYHWLKNQPAGTAVLELPIGQQDKTIWSQQALMTYYATYHWQPIVNGLGGYTPSSYERDAATLNRWPDAAASRLLLQWGVRYVIWHPDWTGRAEPANAAHLPLVKRFADGTQVYAVRKAG